MIKATVKLHDLSPQMPLAAFMVQDVYRRLLQDSFYEVTVTSANDSRHSDNSWHYKGRALDFRTNDLPSDFDRNTLRAAVKEALGPQFDVVMEDIGGQNEHLHIEWEDR